MCAMGAANIADGQVGDLVIGATEEDTFERSALPFGIANRPSAALQHSGALTTQTGSCRRRRK